MDRLVVDGDFFRGAGMLPIHYTFRKEINHRGHGDDRRE